MKSVVSVFALAAAAIWGQHQCPAREALSIVSDFEGASVAEVVIDQTSRTVSFMPGGDPERGWPCWWYFRIDGVTPGETVTLRLRGSTARSGDEKPLAAAWAKPRQATWSTDGTTWLQTAEGRTDSEWMVYTFQPNEESAFVAWGPPYPPGTATALLNQISTTSPYAEAVELCRSREGRSVPMLHVRDGSRPHSQRFGVWIQARQHAWESGSSWVAQGFIEWVVSESVDAAWLRQHADIYIVPVMDVDNAATGNGGKNALPHDHNRDWSENPHWNEVQAAQRRIQELIDAGRMDVFIDLHNPAPGDPTFFYILPPEMLKEPMIGLRNRFIELAYARISRIRPQIPMSNQPKTTGSNYHPLWKHISSNWVSMNGNPHTVSLCLETIWNSKNSTTAGYRAVGSSLAATVREYLAEQSGRTTGLD